MLEYIIGLLIVTAITGGLIFAIPAVIRRYQFSKHCRGKKRNGLMQDCNISLDDALRESVMTELRRKMFERRVGPITKEQFEQLNQTNYE